MPSPGREAIGRRVDHWLGHAPQPGRSGLQSRPHRL